MTGESGRDRHRRVVVLACEEANAIVHAIAFLAVTEGEYLEPMRVSSRPSDLHAIALRCSRISRLAAVNDQLGWSASQSAGGDPVKVTATDVVMRELAAALEATARERLRFPDEKLEHFAFEQAARTIRAAIAAGDAHLSQAPFEARLRSSQPSS